MKTDEAASVWQNMVSLKKNDIVEGDNSGKCHHSRGFICGDLNATYMSCCVCEHILRIVEGQNCVKINHHAMLIFCNKNIEPVLCLLQKTDLVCLCLLSV